MQGAGMTHERKANDEHPDGPEHDDRLPDAADASWSMDPTETDLPPMEGDL